MIIPLIDFSNKRYYLLWYTPIVLYCILSSINFHNSSFDDNKVSRQGVTRKDVYVSMSIDCIFIIIILLLLKILFVILPGCYSSDFIPLLFFFLIVANKDFRTPGLHIGGISIENNTIINKINIIVFNFFRLSFIYFIIICTRFNLFVSTKDYIFFILILLVIINEMSRNITKSNITIVERLLKINVCRQIIIREN